jgi:hypothetical protein
MGIVALLLLTLATFGCRSGDAPQGTAEERRERRLPKAIFLTTGMNYGNGTVAEGVLLALRAFNRHGVPVRLENREILLDANVLGKFDILVMPTASEYHDADRKHSLIHLSDPEMHNLAHWVAAGGMLIAGDNIGRFRLDGSDRSGYSAGQLGPEQWPLSELFGVVLQERNLSGFLLEGRFGAGESRTLMEPSESRWAMVPDTNGSKDLEVLASWRRGSESLPASVRHRSGRGSALLLASSYLLHPSNVGGLSGAADIEAFYEEQLRQYSLGGSAVVSPGGLGNVDVELAPWPAGRPYAFTVSLDAEGDSASYHRIRSSLDGRGVHPTYFVNANLDSRVADSLGQGDAPLQSTGFEPLYATAVGYHALQMNLLRNENHWQRRFSGFRFPYGVASYAGLAGLAARGYLYDASIGLDQLVQLRGSAVPYNIPITNSGFEVPIPLNSSYRSTAVLEISPVLLDDYAFFPKLTQSDSYLEPERERDSRLYQSHLGNTLEQVVKPCAGVMHYFGHLAGTGHDELTLRPLETLVGWTQRDSAWSATTEEIALWRNRLAQFDFTLGEDSLHQVIQVEGPDSLVLPEVALRLARVPTEVHSTLGASRVVLRQGTPYIVFVARARERLEIDYH